MKPNIKHSLLKVLKTWNSSQIFVGAAIVLLTLFITLLCVGFLVRYEVDSDVSSIYSIPYWQENLPQEQQKWYRKGIEELKFALRKNWNRNAARNVVIFTASGISAEALAAVRFNETGFAREQPLSWDTFPHLARLKNSCSNADICDLFTISTALYSGVKTNFKVGGLDAGVSFRDCLAASNETHQLKSILRQAQLNGLRTGLVTTKRVTGPIAAALYAHTPDTSWECDAAVPKAPPFAACQDIAQQLALGETGQRLNVIMGGGRQALVTDVPQRPWDPIDETICNSQNKRNLIRDWRKLKLLAKARYTVLQNEDEMLSLNGSMVDYALGIYANGDLRPRLKTNEVGNDMPQLADMVEKALQVLQRKKQGFALFVEAGAEAGSSIGQQAQELLEINRVIEKTMKKSSLSVDNTLFVVVFTEEAFVRNAWDTSAEVQIGSTFHETANDEPFWESHLDDIITDTMVYANGPKAYLLHGVHEETYLSYVISFALQMGQFNREQYLKFGK